MKIKNLKIRNLLAQTDKTAVPFYYIKQNRSLFSLIPCKWESCGKCGIVRQGRFMYYYQSSQTLCRECTENVLTKPKTRISDLSETTRAVISNNFNWIKGNVVNQDAQNRLGQVSDLFDIGANIMPALPILLEDKLPRGAKELLQGCIVPMLNILYLGDPVNDKPGTLVFTKDGT